MGRHHARLELVLASAVVLHPAEVHGAYRVEIDANPDALTAALVSMTQGVRVAPIALALPGQVHLGWINPDLQDADGRSPMLNTLANRLFRRIDLRGPVVALGWIGPDGHHQLEVNSDLADTIDELMVDANADFNLAFSWDAGFGTAAAASGSLIPFQPRSSQPRPPMMDGPPVTDIAPAAAGGAVAGAGVRELPEGDSDPEDQDNNP